MSSSLFLISLLFTALHSVAVEHIFIYKGDFWKIEPNGIVLLAT